jgi:hypothetical protein
MNTDLEAAKDRWIRAGQEWLRGGKNVTIGGPQHREVLAAYRDYDNLARKAGIAPPSSALSDGFG